jgi:hypothetical protein
VRESVNGFRCCNASQKRALLRKRLAARLRARWNPRVWVESRHLHPSSILTGTAITARRPAIRQFLRRIAARVLHAPDADAPARAVFHRGQRQGGGAGRARPGRRWRRRISSPSSAATSAAARQPLAAVYSGHQFGHWAGQLGDGRAILLGELRGSRRSDGAAAEGRRHDALLAHGRRPRRAALLDPRIPVLRSHGRARHPDHARPDAHRFAPAGGARNHRERRRRHAHGAFFVRFGSFEHWHYRGKQEELRTWPTT